jgi:hypothetical protein
MSVIPLPTIPSVLSIDSTLRTLAACRRDWHFAHIAGENGEPVISATFDATGAVIRARWTGSDWLVLTAEPAMIARSSTLVAAFEQALGFRVGVSPHAQFPGAGRHTSTARVCVEPEAEPMNLAKIVRRAFSKRVGTRCAQTDLRKFSLVNCCGKQLAYLSRGTKHAIGVPRFDSALTQWGIVVRRRTRPVWQTGLAVRR